MGVALSSNLLGAMLGGCLEYNAMYFGYRSLYVVALVIYALALVSSVWRGGRARPVEIPRTSPGDEEPRTAVTAA